MSDGPHPTPAPLAYLLTWTTYGTWLRGDPRGSVRDDNRFGAPYADPDAPAAVRDRAHLKHPPVQLSADERAAADRAIRDVCTHRAWALLALNVRTNHVHAVVTAPCPPEKVMVDFKAWSTRKLRSLDPARFADRVWTKHGSTRYLFDHPSVERAIGYVLHEQ